MSPEKIQLGRMGIWERCKFLPRGLEPEIEFGAF